MAETSMLFPEPTKIAFNSRFLRNTRMECRLHFTAKTETFYGQTNIRLPNEFIPQTILRLNKPILKNSTIVFFSNVTISP